MPGSARMKGNFPPISNRLRGIGAIDLRTVLTRDALPVRCVHHDRKIRTFDASR